MTIYSTCPLISAFRSSKLKIAIPDYVLCMRHGICSSRPYMRTASSPPLGISGYSVLGGKTSGAAYIHLGEKRRSTECVKACVEQSVGVS